MIYFVGAGCGAPDLITVRGKNLLQKADVIIYAGSLVNPELLTYARRDCEIHDSARLHLDEILQIMQNAEAQNQITVRLHTGDPSVYGAIREQMDRLKALQIDYEICPGVSSFCGAAAALQAEYTLPDVSQTVILTRMAGRTPVPERESIRSLAEHHATMVIFLSAGMTEELTEQLLYGYSSDTPAAIVCKASWPDEQILRCTLGTLAQTAKEHAVSRHALILVGDFLGDDYTLSKLYDAEFETAYRGKSK